MSRNIFLSGGVLIFCLLFVWQDKAEAQQCSLSHNFCNLYQQESDWLPDPYVTNATCACRVTPDDSENSCVREYLQEQTKNYPYKAAAQWAKENLDPNTYKQWVKCNLAPWIYTIHVQAYQKCGCECDPACYASWIVVTLLFESKTCAAVCLGIRQRGPCTVGPGFGDCSRLTCPLISQCPESPFCPPPSSQCSGLCPPPGCTECPSSGCIPRKICEGCCPLQECTQCCPDSIPGCSEPTCQGQSCSNQSCL